MRAHHRHLTQHAPTRRMSSESGGSFDEEKTLGISYDTASSIYYVQQYHTARWNDIPKAEKNIKQLACRQVCYFREKTLLLVKIGERNTHEGYLLPVYIQIP